MTWQTIAVLYALGALLTLAYLLNAGRRGFRRRAVQVLVSLGWPVYWIGIQGPRATLIIASQFVVFLLLSCFLLALLPFAALERRNLM